MKRKGGVAVKQEAGSEKRNSKYLFLLFFITLLVIAFLVVRPFLSTLIVAAIFSYVLYPVYRYFHSLTRMKGFSAVILIIMVLLLVSIPLVFIAGKITNESYSVYLEARSVVLESGNFKEVCSGDAGFFCSIYGFFSSVSERYGIDLRNDFAQGFSSLAAALVSKASGFLMNIPNFLLHLFIALFAMYYMLTQGEEMVAALKRALPLKQQDSERILGHFNDIIYATVYGAIVVAVVQGVFAGLGYVIFGVDSPVLLALITLLASFIPFLGAALVWLPASVMLLAEGVMENDSSLMLKAGGLVIYCAIFVSTIDNFLRPRIVGDRAKIHPLVILLGVFGGLALFGFAGIMIGPLLLTLFMASLKIYEQEKGRIA
jgi:predicted PurR-regulated permease PerM